MQYSCFASCAFGLETVVASELKKMDINDVKAQTARVYFSASKKDIAKVNIRIRAADRVYIEIARFTATTFDMLYEGVRNIAWENYISKNAAFPVNADAVNSQLFSVSDIQSISKKAVAVRMMDKYRTSVLPETEERYDIHVKILNDIASVCLNVSGQGLNRRGYRVANVKAPIRETLAAGLVMLSRWRDGDFADPMCGSGTIAIEAAMIGSHIAPGLNRPFDGEKWPLFNDEWKLEREAARLQIIKGPGVYASDIDTGAIRAASKNAKVAGVAIKLYNAGIKDFSRRECTVITNPPYAKRLGDRAGVHALYKEMGVALRDVQQKYFITADDQFERYFGRRASKKRKLYNGNIRCTMYQYY